MERVFIGLGSNLGDRIAMLRKAVHALESVPGATIRSISPVYETEPVGHKNQPFFLNAVVELDSTFPASTLLWKLKEIERSVGRTPAEKWGPREIDLDLIYYGDLVLNEPGLVVPHPEAFRRRFVLTPLADIAADFIDPLRKRTMRALLEECPDESPVTKVPSTIQSSSVEC